MLASWLVATAVTALLLWLDRRRLPPESRARDWGEVTTWLVLSGMFLPSLICFGAHVWVTRTDAPHVRALKALAGTALAVGLGMLVNALLLEALMAAGLA